MSSVTTMLREQRLRYAIMRETDRQAVTLDDQIVDGLVAFAMQNIDSAFPDEEARMDASERAERDLQPVIASISAYPTKSVAEILDTTEVRVFPWTRTHE